MNRYFHTHGITQWSFGGVTYTADADALFSPRTAAEDAMFRAAGFSQVRSPVAETIVQRPTYMVVGHSIAGQSSATLGVSTGYVLNDAQAGQKVFNVNAGYGASLAANDQLAIQLHDGQVWCDTVEGVAGDVVTMKNKLPRFVRGSSSFGLIQKYTARRPDGYQLNAGMITTANALLGGPMQFAGSYGYGGASYEQIMSDLPALLLSARPNIVFLYLFENSISAARSTLADELVRKAKRAAQVCLQYGATPVIMATVPCGPAYVNTGFSAAAWDAVNALCKATRLAGVPGAYGISCEGWMDPAHSVNQRIPLASIAADGIHPDVTRGYTVGNYIAPQLSDILNLMGVGFTPSSAFDDGYLPQADRYLSGAGGTLISGDNGATAGVGAIPAGWLFSTMGTGATATLSKNPDGSLKIAGAFSGSGSQNMIWRLRHVGVVGIAAASESSGVSGRFLLRINGAVNLSNIRAEINFDGLLGMRVCSDLRAGIFQDPTIPGKTILLETANGFIPPGATASRLDLVFTLASGVGSASFDVDVIAGDCSQAAPPRLLV